MTGSEDGSDSSHASNASDAPEHGHAASAASFWRLRCAGIGLLALVLRVLYVRQVWPHPAIQLPVIDAEAYRDRGLEILAGDWLGSAVYYLDPLYPFFLAAIYTVIPPDTIGVLFAQATLDTVSVVLLMLLARRVWDERVATLAGLIAATYKPFFYYSALLLKAPLMIFLIVVALYLVVRAASGNKAIAWLPAGFFLGLAALTRGNSLLFVPVLGLWILFLGRGDLRDKILAGSVLGLGLVCAIGPVSVRNYVVGDDLVILNSQAGQNFYIGHFDGNETGAYVAPPFLRPNPAFEEADFAAEALKRSGRRMKPSEISNFWLGEGLEEIRDDPMRFIRHSFRKALVLVNHYEIPDNASYEYFEREVSTMLGWPLPSYAVVLCLAGAGVVASLRNRLAGLLMLYFLAYSAGIILFFNLSRLRLPLVPVLIMLAASGVVFVFDRLRKREFKQAAAAITVALVLVPITNLDLVRQDLNVRYVNMGVGFLNDSDDRWAEAEALLEKGQVAEADASAERSLEQRIRAEEQFERALEVDPDYFPAERALKRSLATRIVQLDHLGRDGEALDLALEVVDRFDRFAPGYIMLGNAQVKRGHLALARKAYTRALQLDPRNRRALKALRRLASPRP